MSRTFLRVRTAAVAVLAVLSIGGVAAAATGLASPPAERAATQASPRTPDGQVGHAQGGAATLLHGPDAAVGSSRSVPGKPSDHAAGPDASGAARHGLCQAWFAGQGDDHGRRTDSKAFQALAAAAGDADQVSAYCRADPRASAEVGRPAAPSGGGSSKASPTPTNGPAESPGRGQGQGQGGPPTT
jgi:hypothetical protein